MWISNGRQNFHTPFLIIQLKLPLTGITEIQFSSTIAVSQPPFSHLSFSHLYNGKVDPVGPKWEAVSIAPEKDALGEGHCTAKI